MPNDRIRAFEPGLRGGFARYLDTHCRQSRPVGIPRNP
jgi:hypothetical protein